MQPAILYIHDPAAHLSPEPLRSMWAGLSPEGSCAFRLASSRAQRVGDWLILLDEGYDGRLLENRLRRLTRKLSAPVMHIEWDERLDELHLHIWQQGQQVSGLSADGVGTELPLLTELMGLDPLEAWRTIT